MLGVFMCCLFSLPCFKCYGENVSIIEGQPNQNLVACLTDIVRKYFSDEKTLTYVDMNSDDFEILKAIHLSTVTTMIFRQATTQSYFRHQGYLIMVKNASEITKMLKYLLKDTTWNPSARFIIVVRSLDQDDLNKIFDELLKRHVVNVLVVDADEAHLYTYNPFDRYACGKYYDNVISFGLCSNTTKDLFPNKYVTGLRNCTFHATVPHRPPYTVHPDLAENDEKKLGAEQYVFKVIGELEHFKVNFGLNFVNDEFTIVTPDMKVIGPMAMLPNNETDVMFGDTVLLSSRADAFTYLHGYLDYDDDLRFIVKKASYVAKWKNAYLEFNPIVWGLLLLVYLMYSIIMIILLQVVDKTNFMLKLLKYLLSSGSSMPHQMNSNVRCIFIIWVWFASLMNSHYQSSLVSLIGKPIKEHQVSNEADLMKHNFKPCIVPGMLEYMKSETNKSPAINSDCLDPLKNLIKVAQSEDLFTLMPQSIYLYNKKMYYDEFGHSPLFCFDKPYVKLISGMFFYKGFPVSDRMRQNALRLRENGLISKKFGDFYYVRMIKLNFHRKEFESRFATPWFIYFVGCALAVIVFIFELLVTRFSLQM